MILSRAELDRLAATTLPVEDVKIDDWGVFRVQGLSAAARDRYEASVVVMRRGPGGRLEEGRDFDNVRAKLVVMCLIDDQGTRLYGDHEYDVLGAFPAAVVDKLWETACRLSGMGEADIKELIEDFAPTRGPSSSTPSPSPSGAPSPSLGSGSPGGS